MLLKFKEWMQLIWTAEQLADCYLTKRIKQSCWYYSAGPLVIGLHFSGADSSRRDSLIGADDKTLRGRRYPDKMVIMVPRNLAWGLSSTGGGRGWKQDIFETSLNWTSRGRKRPTFYNTTSLASGLDWRKTGLLSQSVSQIYLLLCNVPDQQNDAVSCVSIGLTKSGWQPPLVSANSQTQSSANKTVHHYPTVSNTCKCFARDICIKAAQSPGVNSPDSRLTVMSFNYDNHKEIASLCWTRNEKYY